jgi:TonB family protein
MVSYIGATEQTAMFIAFLAAATGAVAPKPSVDPASWFSWDVYPAEAVNKGLEGSVDFEVDVDANGKPIACRIASSSGQPILDQATCDVIRLKARFNAARNSDGKPIAGQYSNTAVWRIAGPPTPGHHAVVLDFSNDPTHPTCTIQSAGSSMPGPTCANMLEKFGPTLASVGARWTKMVVVTSVTAADQEPYLGEPDWGARLSYLESEQYFLDKAKPVACVTVAAEGMDIGQDACAQFGGSRSPDESVKRSARKMRVEVSIYAAPRK